MQNHLTEILWSSAGLLLGGMIGLMFGKVQDLAHRRYKKLQQEGKWSGIGMIPGSMTRVAVLCLALVLVQWVCPFLFSNHHQWWVSGGVVAGYGLMLFFQLREKFAQSSVSK